MGHPIQHEQTNPIEPVTFFSPLGLRLQSASIREWIIAKFTNLTEAYFTCTVIGLLSTLIDLAIS